MNFVLIVDGWFMIVNIFRRILVFFVSSVFEFFIMTSMEIKLGIFRYLDILIKVLLYENCVFKIILCIFIVIFVKVG